MCCSTSRRCVAKSSRRGRIEAVPALALAPLRTPGWDMNPQNDAQRLHPSHAPRAKRNAFGGPKCGGRLWLRWLAPRKASHQIQGATSTRFVVLFQKVRRAHKDPRKCGGTFMGSEARSFHDYKYILPGKLVGEIIYYTFLYIYIDMY